MYDTVSIRLSDSTVLASSFLQLYQEMGQEQDNFVCIL